MLHRLFLSRAVPVAMVAASAFGQNTLRLRDGDFTTVHRIAAGTVGREGGEPRLKVKNYAGDFTHTFQNGDAVFVQGVRGCPEMNGYRVVIAADQGSGGLGLADEAGAPITCSSAWVENYEAGRIGAVRQYTLPPHPRIYIPPDGPLSVKVNGSAAAAPVAAENSPAWQGLVKRFGNGGSAPAFNEGCDGVTPSLCPNAEARMATGDIYFGYSLPGLGLFWYADQNAAASGPYPSGTARLSSAIYWLNHIERLPANQTANGPLNYGFPYMSAYGKGSTADWTSLLMHGAAVLYTQVRSQMTAEQRTAFANKMLNGIEPDTACALNAPVDTGNTVTLTAGSTAVTASGGLSAFSPNDWLLAVGSTNYPSNRFAWVRIASVVDDTHAVLAGGAPAYYGGVPMFRVPAQPVDFQAWNQGQCGLAGLANMHGYSPGYATVSQIATSSAGYGPEATAITLNADAAAITLTPPFYLFNTHGEMMQVTSRSGRDLQVVRHIYGTTPFAISNGEALVARHWSGYVSLASPFVATGDWQQNLTLNKQVGFIAAGLALADDDPRAMALLANAVNYYHDYTLFDLERSATIRMQGGWTGGYQMGRWGDMTAQIAAMLETIGYDKASPGFLKRYANYPLYLTWPGQTATGPGEDWKSVFPSDLWWVWPLQHFANGSDEQKHIRYWYDTANQWNTPSGWQGPAANWGIFYRLLYASESDPSADYRQTLDPWMIATTTDNTASSYPYGILVSKKSWSGGSYLVANAVSLATDHDYGDTTFRNAGDYIVSYNDAALIGGANGGNVWAGDAAGGAFEIAGGFGLRRIGCCNWTEAHPASEGGDVARVDQAFGAADRVAARLNYIDVWKSAARLTRAYRYFLHLKTGPEYVVVFDDVASSQPNQKRARLHYTKLGDPGATLDGGGTASMVFRKPSQGAMVSTTLLFPDGSSPAITDVATIAANNETIDWGSTTGAQMIAIHRVAGTVADRAGGARLAAADAGSVAAEIDDGDRSWLIVFPRDGSVQPSRSATSRYAGNGRAVFQGLAPGSYRLLQDGVVRQTDLSAGGDGSLSFAANGAHTFTVQQKLPLRRGTHK